MLPQSRPIVVDGKPYRYLIKKAQVDSHPDQWENVLTFKEDSSVPGMPCYQRRFPYGSAITPRIVSEVIREALKEGLSIDCKGEVRRSP